VLSGQVILENMARGLPGERRFLLRELQLIEKRSDGRAMDRPPPGPPLGGRGSAPPMGGAMMDAALLALAQDSIEFHAPWVNGFIWTDKRVPLAPADPAEMERLGWYAERMASDLAFGLEHGCPYCGGVLIVGPCRRCRRADRLHGSGAKLN
jgi:hypothetical protein